MSRSSRPYRGPIIDARLMLLAFALASPAAYLSTQGLLSTDALLTRFLVIVVCCIGVSALVRTVWPLLLGDPTPEPVPTKADGKAASRPGAQEGPTHLGNGFDLLEDDIDPTLLLSPAPTPPSSLPQ
jgi:hypothetical protein